MPVYSVSDHLGEAIHLFLRDFRPIRLPFSLVPITPRHPFRGALDLPVSFLVNAFYFDHNRFGFGLAAIATCSY